MPKTLLHDLRWLKLVKQWLNWAWGQFCLHHKLELHRADIRMCILISLCYIVFDIFPNQQTKNHHFLSKNSEPWFYKWNFYQNQIFLIVYVWSDILWHERVAPITQKGRCNCWHYFDKGRTDCRTETDREVQWNKLTRLIQSILYWPVKSIVDKIEWTQSYSVDEWSVRTRADVLFIDWWWFTTLKELCSNSYSELCGTTLEHQVNSKFNKTQDLSV